MNYELIKKLHESGYKLPVYEEERNGYPEYNEIFEISGEKYLAPTLEELIEASKMHVLQQGLDKIWRAWGSYGYGSREGEGKTPLIAVANLWLALNKK